MATLKDMLPYESEEQEKAAWEQFSGRARELGKKMAEERNERVKQAFEEWRDSRHSDTCTCLTCKDNRRGAYSIEGHFRGKCKRVGNCFVPEDPEAMWNWVKEAERELTAKTMLTVITGVGFEPIYILNTGE